MTNHKIFLFVFASIVLFSCKKNWIDERSNKALDVPTTVTDFQALLDNTNYMNDLRPSMGETSADNYYLTDAMWQGWSTIPRNVYIWSADIYNGVGMDTYNWNYSYRQVFYANIVLDDIDKVGSGELNTSAWNNVKGSALYYRADAFFNVAQLFVKPYSLNSDDLGIPLRLNADPNGTSIRAGLQETYQQILKDLNNSVNYLPNIPLYKTRPSKPAAYAMLSRVYLGMHDYSKALVYADSCLKLFDSVLDYNTLKTNVTYPVPAFNKEVIYQATIGDDLYSTGYIVDSTLYKSYANNDLRKSLFFKPNQTGLLNYYGTYTGGSASSQSKAFGGIATDEVYLTRAECYVRTGNITLAMNDLNTVISKRWKTGTFVPFTATGTSEAMNFILQERRKETPFRGLRWIDLKRLNSEGANITLTRTLNNQSYYLPPNDPRYVLPIPPDIIAITGMTQNER